MASILDTPTSVAAATHTFSVSAGTSRALIVGLTTEGTQSGSHTCTYGGQTMTLVVSEIAGSGTTQQTVSLFFLNDSGIQAASGTTITPGNVPGDISIHAASYQDCVQTTPTNTDSDTTAGSTPNPLANCDIITGAANAIVCTVSGMGNAGSATWAAPLTERTDQATASANGSYADDEVPTATTIACECTWSSQNRSAIVALELVHLASEGITDIDPTEFDMDAGDVDINGSNFLATQGTGTVYISDADTLAGSVNEVEIANGVNTWSDTVVNLDLTGLNATEQTNLNTLGPGTRYIILVNNDSDEYGSSAITLHRAEAFVMSLGAGTPGATTARLTAPATKTTGDFDAGRFEEAANPATAVDITADDYTEMVWSIEAQTLSREVSYDFRVTKSGTVVDTYTVTPQVTISAVTDITDEIASATFTLTAATIGSLYNHVTPIATASFAITPSSVGSFQNRKTQVDSASFAITTAEISSYAERTTAIDSATYSITPSSIGSLYNRITQIDSAAFTITPSDVGSLAQRTTAIDSATYTLTAGDIGSLYNPRTAIESAAYVITAADITSTYNALAETTSAESASFVLTPSSVSSLYNRLTSIDSATYQIVTADITSTYIAGIETTFAESASFVITPGEVGSFYNRTTEVESATFSLTTGDIGSFKHHVIDVDSAAFNLTTSVISSLYNRVTPIETAVFTITTGDVSSDYIVPLTGTTTYYTGRQMLITLDDTAFPLEIAVDNTGGVTGLTITASIRDPADSASYLDFNDSTFKPSGWTTKAQSLTEYGSGFYGVSLDVSAITNMPTGKHLSVEYDITGTVTGVRAEMLTVNQEVMDINTRTEFYTKTLKNRRRVIKDGSSWYLEVYDDDDAAVIMKKLLHDYGNNDIYDMETGILAEEHKSSV